MERNTIQKTIIYKTVYDMKNHPTAEEVYNEVYSLYPNISKGTVYRALNKFADDGKILRVSIANAPDRYDFHSLPHAHCLCEKCGRVFDYELKVFPEINMENHNFYAKTINVVAKGICKDCLIEEEKKCS